MAKNKYYDYLKPKLPQQSFSDIVDQQLSIIQQQQQDRAAQDMQIMKARQKSFESQQRELLGFDVADMSEVDKQTFAAKKDWLKGRIDNFYYNPSNYAEFVEDVNSLKGLHSTLKNHYDNTKTSMNNLEGWVSGTKQWTQKDLELKDDINTLNAKRQMWEMSGVDVESIQVDPATGDTYAFYTDINGNRMKDQSGQDMYGLASQAPSRGSQEYFSPTSSPYANVLPGKFSGGFSAAANRLKNNPQLSMEQRMSTLRSWVTTEALQNQSVMATANAQFMENYGESARAAITQDAKNDPGDGSYVPIQMREYIDETMKFLQGNLVKVQANDGKTTSINEAFPGSQQFDIQSFAEMQPQMLGSVLPDDTYGEGITALMVPRTTAGRSTITVESSWNPEFFNGSRRTMVGDNYKVASVGMDTSRRLFVMAETYIEEDRNNYTEEQIARLSALPGVVIEENKIKRKKEIPILVEPTTVNIDGNSTPNQEWISIVAQIGRVAGVKGERREQILKGMEILNNWNDETAQINASLPASM